MDKIASALVKAQRAFGPALKDKTNPAFRSKYADLGACIEAVIDALNGAGIALIQKQHPHEGGVMVETIFLHESGESFSAGLLAVPASKQDPQGYGSALTYARRYSLMAACGIAPEDDDGNAATKQRPKLPELTEKREPAPRDDGSIFNAQRIATNISAGIAKDDTAGAAGFLATLAQPQLDAVWPLLSQAHQDALTAAWPQDKAA